MKTLADQAYMSLLHLALCRKLDLAAVDAISVGMTKKDYLITASESFEAVANELASTLVNIRASSNADG